MVEISEPGRERTIGKGREEDREESDDGVICALRGGDGGGEEGGGHEGVGVS